MRRYLSPDFIITPELEAAFKEACPRKSGSRQHNRETNAMREAFVLGTLWGSDKMAAILEELNALKAREEEIYAQAALKNSWWSVGGTPEQQQEFIAGFQRGRQLEPLELKPNPLPFIDGHEAGWPEWLK